MSRGTLALALLATTLLLLSGAPTARGAPPVPSHYTPQVGDTFSFTESTLLLDGFGNYTGYTEHSYYNGSLQVTAVNGPLVTVYFENTGVYNNNQGQSQPEGENGNFTFNDENYSYVQGTDDQYGYSNPLTVWFYMNNSDTTGASLSTLDTPLTVLSTSTPYQLPEASSGYANSIFTEGTGSYQRNDDYGLFTATYTAMYFFDPNTGWLLGYSWTEADNDGNGDGFTWIDDLHITSSSYALTVANAPTTATVALSISGPSCAVVFNGENTTNGGSISVLPGATYLLAAYPCNGASFTSWSASGGTLSSTSAADVLLTVSGSGTLTATFTPTPAPFPWGLVVLVILFLFILLIIIVVIVRARRHRRPRGYLPQHSYGGGAPYGGYGGAPMGGPSYGGPAPINLSGGASGQPPVQQIVIKETVKVPCAYCGTLIDSTATACPKCGAPRT